MILVFRHLFHSNYVGLSLWPFIILKEDYLKGDEILINHEKIHLQQQKELLVLPFYIIYILEWAFKLIIYRNSYKAYQNLSFEREAFDHEKDLDYLTRRSPYGFINYFFRRSQ